MRRTCSSRTLPDSARGPPELCFLQISCSILPCVLHALRPASRGRRMTNKGGRRRRPPPPFIIHFYNELISISAILRAQCRFHTANVVRNSQICNCALDLCKNTMLDIKNPWPLQYIPPSWGGISPSLLPPLGGRTFDNLTIRLVKHHIKRVGRESKIHVFLLCFVFCVVTVQN